jgi:FkbM family methyltransferase
MDLRRAFTALERTDIELASRRAANTRYLGDYTALTRVLDTFNVFVDTRDLSVAPHLMVDGYWEMWLTGAVVNFVKPGMRCIDVGANVGYYSLLLANLAGEAGEVLAIEPNERTCSLLRDSMQINGFGGEKNYSIAHMAVGSERDQQGHLFTQINDMGGAKIYPYDDAPIGSMPVKVMPLDDVRWDLPIDFIKIDAEGYELRIWRGMQRIIQESPNLNVMMEFDARGLERVDGAGAAEELLKEITVSGMKLHSVNTEAQIVPVTFSEALTPDTGSHRTLWLRK